MFNNRRILLVAAHPDDIESGCGGTVSKYRECGNKVKAIVFAPCLEDPLNSGILQEFRASMHDLGVEEAIEYNFPRDILEQSRPQIRNILHNLKISFNPQIVLCPSLTDLHQDHRNVAECCLTIFRDSATLLGYEMIRSSVSFSPTLYIVLNEEEMKRKLSILKHYKTQTRRLYFKPEIFKAHAIFRGSQILTRYAEAFEVMRMTDR
jgi:LmbE family N-acetylglucosaminyl deacetylase